MGEERQKKRNRKVESKQRGKLPQVLMKIDLDRRLGRNQLHGSGGAQLKSGS